jgi:hypothetical protein
METDAKRPYRGLRGRPEFSRTTLGRFRFLARVVAIEKALDLAQQSS